jgi:hypothetical protein
VGAPTPREWVKSREEGLGGSWVKGLRGLPEVVSGLDPRPAVVAAEVCP